MRISHKYSSENIKSQLARRLNRLDNAWRHVSSGKRVERPSDDPTAVSRIITYRSLQSEVQQRRFQAQQGLSVLDSADTALENAGQIMLKVQELAVAAGSGAASASDRQIMGGQVDELLQELNKIADTRFDDRLLFAPGIGGAAVGDAAGVNLDRSVVFGPAIAALEAMRDELMAGNPISAATDAALKSSQEQLINTRIQVGARANQLEALDNRLLAMEQDLMARRSADEEVDIARAMVELSEEEVAYQTALAATSRIMRVSLVDFL